MKSVLYVASLALFLVSGVSAGVAGEGKAGKDKAAKAETAAGEVTLKGDMVCAKCALKEGDKCQNVLKVAEGSKETRYYLADNQTAKDNHKMVCSGKPKAATVVGKVEESKGQKLLTASSIKYE